jgi:hypothetical protein
MVSKLDKVGRHSQGQMLTYIIPWIEQMDLSAEAKRGKLVPLLEVKILFVEMRYITLVRISSSLRINILRIIRLKCNAFGPHWQRR